MTTQLNEIKQVALKNRIWYVASVIICALIVLSVMLFHPVKIKVDTQALEKSERERKALQLQGLAFQQLVIQQTKRIDGLKERDSILLTQSIKNYDAIKSIKFTTDEKIKSFAGYNSNDWAIYYSNLPDPE